MVTVWTNGCFDIIHRGHIEMLQYAKSCGDHLIVGVDTDEKVRTAKGSDRPVNNLDDRMFVLQSLECVDKVVSFDSKKDLEDSIKNYSPDVLVVGSDWRGREVVGAGYAKKVSFFERIPGYSTTEILEK